MSSPPPPQSQFASHILFPNLGKNNPFRWDLSIIQMEKQIRQGQGLPEELGVGLGP